MIYACATDEREIVNLGTADAPEHQKLPCPNLNIPREIDEDGVTTPLDAGDQRRICSACHRPLDRFPIGFPGPSQHVKLADAGATVSLANKGA